jgi:RecJ-like exonuclease
MKNQKICPYCKGKLEQDFAIRHSNRPMIIGGSSTSSPAILDGCHCTKCGIKFVFDKAGKCPNCKGTGLLRHVTYIGGIEQYSHSSLCPTCSGKGVIL